MKILPDGQADEPEPLFLPKKSHLFGKSCLWLCRTYPWEHIVN